MTVTRKYYEALIDGFDLLTKIGDHEVLHYLAVKKDLLHLINRIQKFNVFELTFSDDFMNTVASDVIRDFTTEKLSLINELHYELFTCLHTRRLRYGGELMQYMLRLKRILLQLPADEIALLNSFIKIPGDYYYSHATDIVNEQQKEEELKRINAELKKWPLKKDATKVSKRYYVELENGLKKIIANYQNYIFKNYPEIASEFSFYHKKIRGFVTQAMAKDAYEFRLYAYQAADGDQSVQVIQQYYDFCPSYFYNLEETADTQVSAMVFGMQKNETDFKALLDIPFIHRELVHIFLRIAGEAEIASFVEFLLKCDNYYIQEEPIAKGYRFDLQARMEGQWKFFEIFHRHPRSTSVILEQIKNIKAIQPNGQMVFLFTSRPGDDVAKILDSNRVECVILDDLFNRHFSQQNSKLIHWYIQSVLPGIKKPEPQPGLLFEGGQLIERLQQCPSGDPGWAMFEQIGAQVFKFLFGDNFRNYLADMQSENNLKNHRRDLIVNNNYRNPGSYWAEMKDSFKCAAIIIDFKNYSEPLNANTLFNVSKYTTKGVGDFAIVFSRKGIDETAAIEQHALYRNGKLLIDFSENELIEMIHEKIIGKDPIDRLDSKKFQLIKKA